MIEPEFRLLCLAISPRPRQAAIAAALASAPDWPAVVEGAQRHRILAPVIEGLQPHADAVPAWVLDRLRQMHRRSALHALALAAETRRLVDRLAEAGVNALVLKGAVLSTQLHGDVAARGSGDIDLLVHPRDFWTADALLGGAGYACTVADVSATRQTAAGHLLRDLSYRRGGMMLELHQRLVANPRCFAVDFDELWRDREQVDLGGGGVAGLPDRILPVYLCVHGARHCWERLRWLLDLALVLDHPERARQALAEADRHGLGRPMRLAQTLAAEWLGIPQHGDPVDTRAFVDRFFAGTRWRTAPARGTVPWLRREAWRRLYVYTLKPGWRFPLTEFATDLANPVDWGVLPLPDRLTWLHPLLRPLGWAIRNFRRR